MELFPKPSEIDSKFINKTSKEDVEELIIHLEQRFNEIVEPTSSRQRIDSLHIESLIRIAKAHKSALDVLDQVQARR